MTAAVERESLYRVAPVSAMQMQFWVLNAMNPESSAYHVPSVMRIEGPLQRPVLLSAINEIISRHDVLRTVFKYEKTELTQKIIPVQTIDLPVESVETLDPAQKQDSIENLIFSEISKPFNLESGPLIRSRLIRVSLTEHILVLTIHHCIFDLRSKDLFSLELSNLYNAKTNGRLYQTTNHNNQYADFCHFQKQWMQSKDFQTMLTHWKNKVLNPGETINLPMQRLRPKKRSFRGTAIPFEFSPLEVSAIKRFCDAENTTPYLLLLTGYFILLCQYTGRTSLTLGIPLSNRRKEEFKNVMGCFVNTIPLTVCIPDSFSFQDSLQAVRREMLVCHRIQEMPYQAIVQISKTSRDASTNPLFQFGFTFEHPMKLDFDGLRVTPIPTHHGGSQLDMFATFWEEANGIFGFWEYSTDIYEKTAVEKIILDYRNILNKSLQQPALPIPSLVRSEDNNRYVSISLGSEHSVSEIAALIKDQISKIMEIDFQSIPDSVPFLKAGINSLALVRLSNRIKSVFCVPVSLRQLVRDCNTIVALSSFIFQKISENNHSVDP